MFRLFRWIKDNIAFIFGISLIVLIALFALINVFWVIYAFVKYGSYPVNEIPAWALFYMFRRG